MGTMETVVIISALIAIPTALCVQTALLILARLATLAIIWSLAPQPAQQHVPVRIMLIVLPAPAKLAMQSVKHVQCQQPIALHVLLERKKIQIIFTNIFFF